MSAFDVFSFCVKILSSAGLLTFVGLEKSYLSVIVLYSCFDLCQIILRSARSMKNDECKLQQTKIPANTGYQIIAFTTEHSSAYGT